MTRRQRDEKVLIATPCSWLASLRQHQAAEVVGELRTDPGEVEGAEAFLQQSQEGAEEEAAAEAELPHPWHLAAEVEAVVEAEGGCLPHHLEEVVVGEGEGAEEVQVRIQFSLRAFRSRSRA